MKVVAAYAEGAVIYTESGVGRVLSHTPVRQWVLSLPYRLRFRVASNRGLRYVSTQMRHFRKLIKQEANA